MSENAMRESLLQQNAAASVDAELKMLHGLMEAENSRARRLTIWTLVVWSAWFTAVVSAFVVFLLVPHFAAIRHQPAQPKPAAAAPPAAPAAPAAQQDGFVGTLINVIVGTAISLTLISIVLLPVAGILLLILQILARRSASSSQLRVSVAVIEAQLKLLAATKAGGEPAKD